MRLTLTDRCNSPSPLCLTCCTLQSSPTPTLSSRVARWQQCVSCDLATDQATSVLHPCESCVANSWIGDTLSCTSFETGHSTAYKQGGFGGPHGYSSPSPSTPMGSTSRLVAENQKNKVRIFRDFFRFVFTFKSHKTHVSQMDKKEKKWKVFPEYAFFFKTIDLIGPVTPRGLFSGFFRTLRSIF